MRWFPEAFDGAVSAFLAFTLISCGGNSVAVAPVASVTVTPPIDTLPVGGTVQLTATVQDPSGSGLTGRAITWASSKASVATVSGAGLVTGITAGTANITATSEGIVGTAAVTVQVPLASLPIRGLYVQFERRGAASGFWSGDVLQRFDSVDAVVGTTVHAEVGLELGIMHGMGVNTITFELRSADSLVDPNGFVPPGCNEPPVLGVRWPQPTPTELANLVAFFDLVQSNGMHVLLRLVNTHMEEQPPTNSGTWLGAVLGAIKTHPALELVLFDGTPHLVGTSCGIPAEPPLWLGPTSVPAQYVQWAVGYARSLGVPTRKLSAEAIVGDYFLLSQPPAGPDATSGHLWDPVIVEKDIFDALQIPDSARTYGISFYEHRKCATAGSVPCTDTDPDSWADQTLTQLFVVIGSGSRARVIAGEMGNLTPVSASWSTVQAFQSLVTQMRRHGVHGGAFWRWVSFNTSEDSDPTLADPVKRRGVAFQYNPVQGVLAQTYTGP